MEKPGVGVAVIVIKDGKILLGEDLTKGDSVFYGVPGGHWESRESLADAIEREVLEEVGIKINELQLISVYDFFRYDKNRSYVTIGFKSKWKSGRLKDESETTRRNWAWFSINNLPENIFPPDRILIDRFVSGIIWEE
jgi:8-oxo-dGTP diphosphatase